MSVPTMATMQRNRPNPLLLSLILLHSFIVPSRGFLVQPPFFLPQAKTTTTVFMDHSSATYFDIGDTVTVTEDVMKAGRNLRGLTGQVTYTWEKCDVDPTCCCAEWVDEGLSVHVKFDVPSESNDDNDRALLANDVFIHYFAESELAKTKEDTDETQSASKRAATSNEVEVAFDGLSCKAFKLDKLKMGKQAQRIAAFEESRDKL